MTSLGINASVTFQHGRLERKEVKTDKFSINADSFVERRNCGGAHHVPAVNISINFERHVYLHFSHGFSLWRQDHLSKPEIDIMRLVNDITDRSNWEIDIHGFSANLAWKQEFLGSYFPKHNDMWEWCLFELRRKAAEFSKDKRRSVFILDSASRVCKSDRYVGSDLAKGLKHDTQSLNISPWLFPFVFSISPIRKDGRPITRFNFLKSMTVGVIRRHSFWDSERINNGDPIFYSSKSQWLATDVWFSEDDNKAKIISPINNLHALKNRTIYTTVERLVDDLVEDWNKTLLYKTLARGVSRIQPQPYKCIACSTENPGSCACPTVFRDSSAWAEDRQDKPRQSPWYECGWNPVMALDGLYPSSKRIYDSISLRDGFNDRGLQIYVEISTFKLDKDGSVSTDDEYHFSWGLNGNRNERIVATTVVCLERDNIQSDSGGISFRTETKRKTWENKPRNCQLSDLMAGPSTAPPAMTSPPDPEHPRMPTFQELGTVRLYEGRVVTYPNALQHKFEVPKLEHTSQDGQMKFMQIHLVDPHYVVCSTRFVPPQNVEWWKEAVSYEEIGFKTGLPKELSRDVIDHMLVPEELLNSRNTPSSLLQSYWQTMHYSSDGEQPRQPPIRYESALRRKRLALEKHYRVIDAVNRPRIYGQPRAFTAWVQGRQRLRKPVDDTDENDGTSSDTDENDGTSSDSDENGADPVTTNTTKDDPDTEEEGYRDYDDPLSTPGNSDSERSADGFEYDDADATNDSGAETTGAGAGATAADGSGSAVNAGAQDSAVGDESDAEQDYVDAVVGFTLTELAEMEAEASQSMLDQDSVSIYDDAMSQADELEEDSEKKELEDEEENELQEYDTELEELEAELRELEAKDLEAYYLD